MKTHSYFPILKSALLTEVAPGDLCDAEFSLCLYSVLF